LQNIHAQELPALLPVKAAVAAFGVSRSTIYRQPENGTVKGKKVGRSTYIIVDSLKSWIAALPEYKS
jgi:hypothetical protein